MAGLYTIIGADDFLVAEAAKKIVGDGTGLETIDSNTSVVEETQLRDISAARESAMTPPFLAPRKVTWWKNVKFLPGGHASDGGGVEKEKGAGRAPSQAVKEALEKLAKELAAIDFPDNQKFIISGPALLPTSIVAKTLAAGEMIVFPAKQGANAAARAAERAAELGLSFAPDALERFLETVGQDTRSIYSELDKMKAYLGDGATSVSADDVAAVSSPGAGVETNPWDVTNAICERDARKAIEAARRLEGQNGYAIMVSAMAEKQFRQLVELKAAAEAGRLDAALRDLKPWAARRMAASLRLWTLNELRTARMRFLALRERLMSATSASDEDMVAVELVRALGPARGRGAR